MTSIRQANVSSYAINNVGVVAVKDVVVDLVKRRSADIGAKLLVQEANLVEPDDKDGDLGTEVDVNRYNDIDVEIEAMWGIDETWDNQVNTTSPTFKDKCNGGMVHNSRSDVAHILTTHGDVTSHDDMQGQYQQFQRHTKRWEKKDVKELEMRSV
ncbi:hypothetical protein J5N97_024621 [Dioscorea zingiberensis]|uniref:Uncharacterized protein n=1 Tax=Dioscorea zingiberensis TaxID=325984 RepID=A0A9D5C7B3_9LILI|nr:hypothetical protein J5N97_024621 [Dioscorea zingiberensis]